MQAGFYAGYVASAFTFARFRREEAGDNWWPDINHGILSGFRALSYLRIRRFIEVQTGAQPVVGGSFGKEMVGIEVDFMHVCFHVHEVTSKFMYHCQHSDSGLNQLRATYGLHR